MEKKKKETRGRKALSPAKKRKSVNTAIAKWQAKATRCINVRYNLEHDKEILEKLDSVPNKADYIRQLILKDIKEE